MLRWSLAKSSRRNCTGVIALASFVLRQVSLSFRAGLNSFEAQVVTKLTCFSIAENGVQNAMVENINAATKFGLQKIDQVQNMAWNCSLR